jgi:hypothetical protein
VPTWGKRKVHEITRRDVILLLDGIEDCGVPVLRNCVAELLSRLFLSLCHGPGHRGRVAGNPRSSSGGDGGNRYRNDNR